MYFAEDYNTTTKILPNYISNSRDAVCSGTIAKTTLAGNGATGAITYIRLIRWALFCNRCFCYP